MKNTFKQASIVFSILTVIGAVLFCAFFSVFSMDNMASSHDKFTSHIFHAKELVLATTILSTLSLIIFLFSTLSLIALSFFQLNILSYSKWKYWSNLYIGEPKIRSWLSLFEVSPNFIKPT
ncbi:MAG: hypothetical protein Q8Q95_00210 [bacterium]|nr:hypothetical protein [bacterium]